VDWSGKDYRSWKVPVPDTSDPSDNEEQAGLFDAFRARRAQEQAANEPACSSLSDGSDVSGTGTFQDR